MKQKQAYKKWLDVLEKGIGETLEEAGFFDGPMSEEDYDEYYLNEYDGIRGQRRRGRYDSPLDDRGGYSKGRT